MKNITQAISKQSRPERILQFGEGNFLRAFADWMIDKANKGGAYNGSVVMCQPIAAGLSDKINAQNGLYTLAMRGQLDGKPAEIIEPITCISRCINPYEDYDALLEIARSDALTTVISNTTEAGIAYHAGDKLSDRPPVSFPAKVCALLHERFTFFHGSQDKGLLFLPVELIEDNGANLKRIVLQYAAEWELDDTFISWVTHCNYFCSTLVDRIVTGYPANETEYFENKLGYQDELIVTAEHFRLWAIEGKKEWADILPIHKTEKNVIWTDDVTPYKKQKVRILNGAHTSSILAAYLAGHRIVRDMMKDTVFSKYLDTLLFEEVIPTLDLPKDSLKAFAKEVGERFSNTYIDHKLSDIALNSCSKMNARCVPTLLDYVNLYQKPPKALSFAFAAFIKFYQGDGVRDEESIKAFFQQTWEDSGSITKAVLGNKEFWGGRDLNELPGFTALVAGYLTKMETQDIRDVIEGI